MDAADVTSSWIGVIDARASRSRAAASGAR
jgi:hypothetical protein